MAKMMNDKDIGAMLRKLAKTPGIVYNPKNGDVLADHTPKKHTGKTYSHKDSTMLLTLLHGVCHAKKDLVAVPVAVRTLPTADEWLTRHPLPTTEPAKPVRTLPTRPKKVVVPEHPKKGEESERQCDIHDDMPLQHDGKGGFYCYTCETSVLCHGCECELGENDDWHTKQEEFYCEECYDSERPDCQYD
jgi:hypothetical protein